MPSVKKFDICVARPKGSDGRDGIWWHRIGRAFENDKGQVSLFFDSLPYSDRDGRCQAMLFEQRERDEQPAARSERLRTNNSDDDIPF